MKATSEGILASIFDGFWWILGGKLGGKMEPRSIQKGIEKTIENWKVPRWPQDRNKTRRRTPTPGVRGPGEVPPFKVGETPPLHQKSRERRRFAPDAFIFDVKILAEFYVVSDAFLEGFWKDFPPNWASQIY